MTHRPLIGVVEKDLDGNLELPPARLRHLVGGARDYPRLRRVALVQLERHLQHRGGQGAYYKSKELIKNNKNKLRHY